MQLLSALTRDPKVVAREKPAGHHLPYGAHRDEHTIQTRDGLLMQFIRLRGLMFETADADELNYRKVLRDAMLQAIGSSRFALYHHIVRRRVNVDLEPSFPDAFSEKLDARWRARLATRQLYVNELYLTLVRRPVQGSLGVADRIRSWLGNGPDQRASVAVELRQLTAARNALVAALGSYEPRVLGTYPTGEQLCSEPIEFLSALFNGELAPRLLPHEDVGLYIPERRISFGRNALELASQGHLPRRFTAMVSLKDYAAQTSGGMFDDLLRLPFEMTVSQSFAFVDRQATLGKMNLALRRMRSAEDEALSLRNELGLAKDDVAAGRAGFGEHHMTIAVHAPALDLLDAQVAEVTATLADLGIGAVREDIGTELAFWAQFPGNFKYAVRRGLVSTANFAGMASAHNFAVGSPSRNHWGDAVTLLETTAAGPYFFNFHRADLGNFTVIGPSGSGKTVVLNFLLAQARRFDPRIIFFDKDRGAELFIRAIGGTYGRLTPEAPSGLNPLQLPDTASNRQFLIDWVAQLAGSVTTSERGRIKDAIDASYDQPPEHRRLRYLVELFCGQARPSSDDLWSRLQPWWGKGARAWLFDNADDRTDPGARIVGFATQSARDALESKISSAIIEQAATQIFMVNPKATPEDYCDGFGLSAHELNLVRTLPDSAHCFLIKHGNESAVARLDLSGEHDLLTVLSGRERTVRLADQLRKAKGDDVDAWLPDLLEQAR